MLEEVTNSIREMSSLVDGVAMAVDGSAEADASGLSALAETLRGEVSRFLTAARR